MNLQSICSCQYSLKATMLWKAKGKLPLHEVTSTSAAGHSTKPSYAHKGDKICTIATNTVFMTVKPAPA